MKSEYWRGNAIYFSMAVCVAVIMHYISVHARMECTDDAFIVDECFLYCLMAGVYKSPVTSAVMMFLYCCSCCVMYIHSGWCLCSSL